MRRSGRWVRLGRSWYTVEGWRLLRVPDIRGAVDMDAAMDQNVWARILDDGNEAGSTISEESDADGGWTQDTGEVFRVRFEMVETSGNNANTRTYQLEYNHEGGGWNTVGAGTPIQSAVSAETSRTITDGEATSDRLTGSAGVFGAGQYAEDGLTGAFTIQANRHTDVEYCVTIDAAQVADADTIALRVIMSGAQSTPTYGATPTMTVHKIETTIPHKVTGRKQAAVHDAAIW